MSALPHWKLTWSWTAALEGRFKGHLQQVGRWNFYWTLETSHTPVTAEYGLQDHISANKSHSPLRRKWMLSCTLLRELWNTFLLSQLKIWLQLTTALISIFQLKSIGWFLIVYLSNSREELEINNLNMYFPACCSSSFGGIFKMSQPPNLYSKDSYWQLRWELSLFSMTLL